MWKISRHAVWSAVARHAIFFSRQEFQGSMCSKMDQGICSEFLLYPLVKCLIFCPRFPVPVMVFIRIMHRLQSQKDISVQESREPGRSHHPVHK